MIFEPNQHAYSNFAHFLFVNFILQKKGINELENLIIENKNDILNNFGGNLEQRSEEAKHSSAEQTNSKM